MGLDCAGSGVDFSGGVGCSATYGCLCVAVFSLMPPLCVHSLTEDPAVLGGSWVVISRVISRVTILITHIRGLITPLITTHEPPST